ncbi:MAG: hypothetical protein MUP41_18255 [Desulfobacterales bacterium]|nr:hypothetical protein [Desulfobacterales bacterium]
MIPISLCWDTRKRSVLLKWNGFISAGWQDGKILMKILGSPISLPLKKKGIQLFNKLPIRWIDLKGIFSFLPKWKLKKVEGTFSFPDPMVNGVLYGWMSAIQAGRADRKNRVTVNFLGENGCGGEMTLSLKIFFQYLRSWIFPLIREMRGRKVPKGGES